MRYVFKTSFFRCLSLRADATVNRHSFSPIFNELEYFPIGNFRRLPHCANYALLKKKFGRFWKLSFFELILKIRYILKILVCYCRNLVILCDTWQGKKVNKTILNFSNSSFAQFFQDFCYIWYHNWIRLRDNWTILTDKSSWDTKLKFKKQFLRYFETVHCHTFF